MDSSTPVAVTSADDPGRTAFQATDGVFIDPGSFGEFVDFDVPAGKRLVITFVSGGGSLPTGQTVIRVGLSTGTAGFASHTFVPIFHGTAAPDDERFAFSQDTMIYADDVFRMILERSATTGSATAQFSVSGYLIDCSVEACN